MDIRVDCYAGYRDEETRTAATDDGGTPHQRRGDTETVGWRRITDISRIIGDDGGLYIIRHDPYQNSWQLTCFKENPTMPRQHPCLFLIGDTTGLLTL